MFPGSHGLFSWPRDALLSLRLAAASPLGGVPSRLSPRLHHNIQFVGPRTPSQSVSYHFATPRLNHCYTEMPSKSAKQSKAARRRLSVSTAGNPHHVQQQQHEKFKQPNQGHQPKQPREIHLADLLSPASAPPKGFLDRKRAAQLDEMLMGPEIGFRLEQLMELAGQAVAHAIVQQWPDRMLREQQQQQQPNEGWVRAYEQQHDQDHGEHESQDHEPQPPQQQTRQYQQLRREDLRILIFCGPGNNGGDGLVAGRHLRTLGFQVDLVYPVPGKLGLFQDLVKQCQAFGCRFLQLEDLEPDRVGADYCVLVDAVFGFSFDASRPLRAPFDRLIRFMAEASRLYFRDGRIIEVASPGDPSRPLLVSVDVPSGWDVERGPTRWFSLLEQQRQHEQQALQQEQQAQPQRESPQQPEADSSSASAEHAVAPKHECTLELLPDLLVSLSAPKLCAWALPGSNLCAHVLGGRFLPPAVIHRFGLEHLPEYQEADLVVSVRNHPMAEDD